MSFPGGGSVYSVTIKPSTRSARSIAVTSVLKLWRYGGRGEPPIRLRPTAALGPLAVTFRRSPVESPIKTAFRGVLKRRIRGGHAGLRKNASHPPPLDVIGSILGITFQAAQTWKRKVCANPGRTRWRLRRAA